MTDSVPKQPAARGFLGIFRMSANAEGPGPCVLIFPGHKQEHGLEIQKPEPERLLIWNAGLEGGGTWLIWNVRVYFVVIRFVQNTVFQTSAFHFKFKRKF